MTTNKNTKQAAVVDKPLAKQLSKQQQAAADNAKTNTKNDGSHIAKQRANRLAKAKKAKGEE